MKSTKPKIDKDTIPEGFTVSLALIDALPVIFFSVAFILAGILMQSVLFILGSSVCLLSGTIKVIWKIIVAKRNRNIWWMFVQMRIAMPIGFLIMLVGFLISCFTSDLSSFYNAFTNIPCLIFALIGVMGIITMIVFSIKLDPSDLKSNWIEQICNSSAQLSFLICVLIALLT